MLRCFLLSFCVIGLTNAFVVNLKSLTAPLLPGQSIAVTALDGLFLENFNLLKPLASGFPFSEGRDTTILQSLSKESFIASFTGQPFSLSFNPEQSSCYKQSASGTTEPVDCILMITTYALDGSSTAEKVTLKGDKRGRLGWYPKNRKKRGFDGSSNATVFFSTGVGITLTVRFPDGTGTGFREQFQLGGARLAIMDT